LKDIILSIKPCFSSEIYSGNKPIELRKAIGKEFTEGSRIFIYSSSPVKAIDGCASIEKIEYLSVKIIREKLLPLAKISIESFDDYYKSHDNGYVIWLSKVVKFNEAINLNELRKYGFSAPQSFSYAKANLKPILENLK
jgi:predicted transcriptional regulator